MKSPQNNILRNDWPMVATTTKNVYLCPKITKEMNDEALPNELDEIKLKPYTMEEIFTMVEKGERDIEAGRVYTTEEVIDYCKKGLAQLKKP